jgi:hypothetical protein
MTAVGPSRRSDVLLCPLLPESDLLLPPLPSGGRRTPRNLAPLGRREPCCSRARGSASEPRSLLRRVLRQPGLDTREPAAPADFEMVDAP